MSSVIVVGAGLAGLSCAWRLQRAGIDVEVLERAEEPGGRLRSESLEEFLIESGAAFFTSHDRSLHSIADHLDLSGRVQSVLRYPDATVHAGAFSPLRPIEDPLFLGSKAVSRTASLRLLRLRFEWMRWRRQLDPAHPEAVRSLESESLARYLDRIVGSELRERVIAPYVSAALGLDAENLSAAYLLLLIDRVAGARPQYMVGGMKHLTSQLARRLSVRYRCEVTDIETQSDGARVRYRAGHLQGQLQGHLQGKPQGQRQRSVMADAVVVAVPGTAVTDICPKLTPSERGFFEGVRFSRGVVAHLLFDEAMTFPYRSVSFRRRRGFGLYDVQASHHKRGAAPVGAGLLRASLNEAASERVWSASDAEVGGVVLDNLESTPFGKLSPRRIVVSRSVAASPVFYPGYLGRLKRFAEQSERSERLMFCGDYLVGNGAEAALTSGMRAASQIAQALG
ncbi:MAG: FAD-dependent oxidoreductase [Deltaproteobacteria bacterium]|nr:FAD-dependent oxidoreductase [Deltaproteobacteria bacterium]